MAFKSPYMSGLKIDHFKETKNVSAEIYYILQCFLTIKAQMLLRLIIRVAHNRCRKQPKNG